MTDTFDLAAMIADREKGTPGPWVASPWGDGSSALGVVNVCAPDAWVVIADDVPEADARRIARVPEMEAEILRLREGLTEIECLYYTEAKGASWRAAQMRAIAQEMLK